MKKYTSLNKKNFENTTIKKKMSYAVYKEIISTCNKLIAQEVLDNEAGMLLPFNLGRLIILKTHPKVSQLYSATNPEGKAKKVFNLHSYGWIYRTFHKERTLLKFPYLFKFKPNRETIKKPLYNKIMSGDANYLTAAEYNEYYTDAT